MVGVVISIELFTTPVWAEPLNSAMDLCEFYVSDNLVFLGQYQVIQCM